MCVCGRLLEVRWKDYKESPLRVAITAKRRRQSDAPDCLPEAEECLERAMKEVIQYGSKRKALGV